MDILFEAYVVVGIIVGLIAFVYMMTGFIDDSYDSVDVMLGFMVSCCMAPLVAVVWPLAVIGFIVGVIVK